MRIAVLILGLLLGLLMFLQTLLVYGLSDALNDEASAQASAIGVVMALLWLVACAFVLPFPLVSVVAFAIAGLFGFAASGEFPDLAIWGGVSVVLAVMSIFGWRGKRKHDREVRAEKARQAERDAMLAQMVQRPAE